MHRTFLALAAHCLFALAVQAASPDAAVVPGTSLLFPADYGSHPEFRTEWWYVTGWLTSEAGESLGFQITFFRTKPHLQGDNPSSFNPSQILIAHCAISDPRHGRLWHDQRIRRAGMGLVQASERDTDVTIDGWSLTRQAGNYLAKIDAEDFSIELTLAPTQAVLLNGAAGVSRKGPNSAAASFYYSLPHLRVSGRIGRRDSRTSVQGEAWLDHEWSSEYLDEKAVGWDWIGINLDDGGALMAFRIRDAQGKRRWGGGTLRDRNGTTQIFQPADIEFREARRWVSPRTAVSYPVEWTVRAGGRMFFLSPLFDDQENDARLSTGAIYWEGAVRTLEDGRQVGRGYLELTGYGDKLVLK